MSTTDLMQALAQEQIGYELLRHPPTKRATEEASALHVSPDEVAKTIVLVTQHGRVRVVIPASERVDLRRAREALADGKRVRLASEAELASAYPMYEVGAVPPVGGPAGDRVLVDPRLAARESVVFEAGSHAESMRMRTADLVRMSGAEIVDVCGQ
jgi:prolyl-tRNA editing enzyme YbaK/EbsC (Cys-tRNA(Pro) deacylase)